MVVIRFTNVGEITVHYSLDGAQTSPTLVLINSLGSDLRIWDQMVPSLAERFQVVRYDKRGHGLSDAPDGPYTIRDHSNDLVGLLDHLQIQAAILIGISVGGMIAQDFAACYPQRVAALVLSDTATKIGTADMWNERVDTLRAHGMAHLGEAILARWFAPAFAESHPAEYQGYYNMLTRMPVRGYTATCEAIRDADLSEAAESITAKALVLCGAEDLATPPELGQALAARLPDARFAQIDGAAHLPCIEQPAAMLSQITQFLQENGYV